MKTFIASLIVLASTATVVAILSVKTTAVAENMLSHLDKLQYEANAENAERSLSEIERTWKDGKSIVALTVWHTESGLIDTALAEILASYESDDSSEFMLAAARLRVILSELIDSEHLSFARIF